MAKTIVLINRHVIAANKKNGTTDPPISVRRGRNGKPTYYHEYPFECEAKLVYNPENPLKCGATVWLELEEDGADGVSAQKAG